MLIGIDARLSRQTGVGRYIQNLVKNLSEIDRINNYILFVRPKDKHDLDILSLGKNWKIVEVDIKWHSVDEQIKFTSILNSYNLDLIHFPYFSVPIFYRRPYVVTVHDLIMNKFATGKASTLPLSVYYLKRLVYKFVLKNALNKARRIIVPSESVKEDVVTQYANIDLKKIIVTYEGFFENNLNSKIEQVNYGKYFLRIGNFYPHKNVENLILAFSNFCQNKKNIKLILVGKKDYFYNRINEKILDYKLKEKILFIENPKDDLLMSLYKNSLATIVPSFMEGFSLTCLEAMSMGSIVVASDIRVHREVCKNAALYFDPYSVSDIEKSLEKIYLLDNKKKSELIVLGKDNIKRFSWRKMAEETLVIYESCIGLR